MGSERLPGKMLKKIGDETLIEVVLNRLLKFFPPQKIFVATSSRKDNLKMVVFVTEGTNKEAINVRMSKIGESQVFED